MKQTLKTEKILSAYRVISTSKYSKLDDADKVKVWKIAKAMKPVATQFDEDSKDAAEKLKPTDDFGERLQKAQEYERMLQANEDMSKSPMGAAEYNAFLKEFQDYNKLVSDAVKEFADKEVELVFEGISEDAFGKLMASNEWTMEQVIEIGTLIVE